MIKKIKILVLAFILMFFGLVITNYWISYQAEDHIYDLVEDIPKHKVGLLLGTVK